MSTRSIYADQLRPMIRTRRSELKRPTISRQGTTLRQLLLMTALISACRREHGKPLKPIAHKAELRMQRPFEVQKRIHDPVSGSEVPFPASVDFLGSKGSNPIQFGHGWQSHFAARSNSWSAG